MNAKAYEAAAKALFHAEAGRNSTNWIHAMTWDRLGEITKDAYREASREVVDAYLDASAASLRTAA
jgi:hypothetical protein